MSTAFSAGERNWQVRLGKLRDVVRQEMVARQLERELPAPPVRVIDLGCGQGTQALRLARLGLSSVSGAEARASLLRVQDDALEMLRINSAKHLIIALISREMLHFFQRDIDLTLHMRDWRFIDLQSLII